MASSEVVESQFISRVLHFPGGAQLIQDNAITEDYFSRYKEEFKFIDSHCKAFGSVPSEMTFMSTFTSFPLVTGSTETDQYLLKSIVDNKNIQIVINSLNRARLLLENDDYNSILSVYSQTIDDISKSTGLVARDVISDTESRFQSFEERMKNRARFFCPTGFTEIDKVTGGWDRVNEYAVIAARPGIGKSWALMVSAESALRAGLTVGIFSGEMDYESVAYRFDSISSHISNWKMVHGSSDIETSYKLYLDNLKSSYNTSGGLFILTPDSAGGSVGVSKLKSFIRKYKLDILLVDQQSLLIDDRKGKSSWEQASNKSMDLKTLQVTEKIPIITVSQMNRNKEIDDAGNNKNSTTQIAMSDRISQDATTIIVLSKGKDKLDPKANIITLELLKTRGSGGAEKKFNYVADFDHGNFHYMPDASDGQEESQEGTNDVLDSEEENDGYDVFSKKQ